MNWHQQAACRPGKADPSSFSPVDSRCRVNLPAAKMVARAFCATCPVRPECLDAAMHLTAGGMPPQEIVQAGLWFPLANAADLRPIDLLATEPAKPAGSGAAA